MDLTPNIAFTMDGKINASMILTGELWANLIKTGKIQSHAGAVYFDLDANNGKGELASSVLKGVDDGVTTTAKIGSGSWAGGEPYQGFRISYPGGNSGLLLITIDGISEDFPLANKDEIVSSGDLIIRSNGISEYSGGASGLYLNGNSFMPTLNSFLFNTTATTIIFVLAIPDVFCTTKTKSNLVQMDI